MNSIIINFDVLKKNNLSFDEFILLIKNKYKIEDSINIHDLQLNHFIKIINNNIILRSKSEDLINSLSFDYNIDKNSNNNNDVVNRIDEYRNKWKGLKPGSMGSQKGCTQKLIRWMKENPKYSFDDILKAADIYLSTEGNNIKYLQNAEYFIFKQNQFKEESSRLSSYIDEINNNNDINWVNSLK